MRAAAPLYVERSVRADLDRLWTLTQDPAQHSRWDLRFTEIVHLPAREADPAVTEFRYAVTLVPGLTVAGTGRTLGERSRPDGTRTSALGFGSDHPLSPIRRGRGYWRYVPDGDAVRFLTGYDYDTRWGPVGPVVDRLVFRPAMGWATAWSFDRLRLWAETGQTPERSRTLALAGAGARTCTGVAVAGLLRRTGAGPIAAAGAGLAAAAALTALPRRPAVPSARRCLRTAPDRGSATPPATIERVAVDRVRTDEETTP